MNRIDKDEEVPTGFKFSDCISKFIITENCQPQLMIHLRCYGSKEGERRLDCELIAKIKGETPAPSPRWLEKWGPA